MADFDVSESFPIIIEVIQRTMDAGVAGDGGGDGGNGHHAQQGTMAFDAASNTWHSHCTTHPTGGGNFSMANCIIRDLASTCGVSSQNAPPNSPEPGRGMMLNANAKDHSRMATVDGVPVKADEVKQTASKKIFWNESGKKLDRVVTARRRAINDEEEEEDVDGALHVVDDLHEKKKIQKLGN